MTEFKLHADFTPKGDQPKAIRQLVGGMEKGFKKQTLLGVTGSGKTYTIANVIEKVQKPTLVIAHNKTLAAQLYSEFKEFFPDNAVEYFVSYYDYYQPEAYILQTDTYIEKDASVNEELDRLRLATTQALLSRSDVIVVSSVSCIYGIGSPDEWYNMMVIIRKGQIMPRRDILIQLVDLQYTRNDVDFSKGHFRVRGDTVEVFQSYTQTGIRIELFGDEVDKISEFDALTGKSLQTFDEFTIYPAKHFVMPQERIELAVYRIEEELEDRLAELRYEERLLEAQRLEQRTKFDIEMMREMGYCSGIENYSRHMEGRSEGEPAYTLLEYFPEDYLLVIDESHATVPQLRGMHAGDRSRKNSLVDNGFRLPSAYDNRPLYFSEVEERMDDVIFMSATPADYELEASRQVVEQIIRPTGLVDPAITVKPSKGQIDDLIGEINEVVGRSFRVLVTTLTKRMAEDLTNYLANVNIRVRYMHSDIDTIERTEIVRDLRQGVFDVLVGINLLREGLDIPEVALVAILDADKEGFLRSERSLIQTVGRAARNSESHVVMYADKVTESMRRAIDETDRRRTMQMQYNEEHGITPETIVKAIQKKIVPGQVEDGKKLAAAVEGLERAEVMDMVMELEGEMHAAAEELDFEKAARLRDRVEEMKKVYGV